MESGMVVPSAPIGTAYLVLGLLALLTGVFQAYRKRSQPGLLILWGGLADFGLALMGFGLGASGAVGGTLTIVFHATARLAAWVGLSILVGNPFACTNDDVRGTAYSKPVAGILTGLALIASLGVSPTLTPDGQHLVFHAIGNAGNGPLGSMLLGAVVALGYTVLVWLTARLVVTLCFTRPEENATGCGSCGSCPPGKYLLFALIGLLVLFGLGRHAMELMGAGIAGVAAETLPKLESSWNLAAIVLYAGAFPVLCKRLSAFRTLYAIIIFAVSFVLMAVGSATPLARLFGLIVTGIGTMVAIYSSSYIHDDGRKQWYWFFLMLTFGALLNIVTMTNIGGLTAHWEIMTWASFALIAWECSDKARDAAVKYAVICCGAAYLMFIGLFAIGGNATEYADVINVARNGAVPCMALIFAILGFAAKAGIMPLHSWLPDAHPAAPSSISAPLSGVLTKMGVFGVVVVFFLIYGTQKLSGSLWWGMTPAGLFVSVLGILTMGYGEWMALKQEDLKRMLAYSTMGQVGEIFTVLGIGTWLAATGALAHVLNHAIMKDLLFLCAGGLILRVGSRKLSDMAGLVREMPWTVGCMTIGFIAIMGLPPFNGFVSKYLMIAACIDAGHPLFAVALLAASLVGAIYYVRIMKTLIFDEAPANRPAVAEMPLTMRIPVVVLAALCVLLGICPQLCTGMVAPVANMLTFDSTSVPGVMKALPELTVTWPVYVLVPMIGAIIPFLLRKNRTQAGYAAAGILLVTTLLVLLFGRGLDTLSFIMAFIIPAIGAINMLYAVGYMDHSHTQWRFYCFFLLMVGGLLGVAASSDFFSFFTFWEIMSSWALYFAISHEGTPEAVREGFKYFLFNVAGAGFLFIGIAVIIVYTGVSNFAAVGAALASQSCWVNFAVMALFAIGFCMKAAQVSLRIDWQMHPALAPTPVSGYISSVLLKIAVFGLVKLFLIFGAVAAQSPATLPFSQSTIMYIVAWIGGFTLLYSALQAMLQDNLKLVFIWSTVSQIGYMVLGVAIGTSLGMAGGLLHMLNHVFFKDLLFLMVGALMIGAHAQTVSELGGVGRKMPVTMFCFFIGGLAAVGVPPTNGFTSKWIIYQALMAEGEPLLALVSLVGSVVTLAYLARFMHTAFLGQPLSPEKLEHVHEAPFVMRVPMLFLAFMTILTGVFPGLLLAPVNAALVEFNMPALDVTYYGLATGPGAWNATAVAVLMLVGFGGAAWLVRRLLARTSIVDITPHACGHTVEDAVTRMPAASVYGSLVNLCTGGAGVLTLTDSVRRISRSICGLVCRNK